jgi:hypothetical protein
MQNQLPSARKVTQLEQHTNVLVVGMLVYLVTMSLLLATAHEIWEVTSGNEAWYLQRKGSWPDLLPGIADWLVTTVRWVARDTCAESVGSAATCALVLALLLQLPCGLLVVSLAR